MSQVQARSSPLMETLAGVAVALVVVYGGYRVIYHGQQPGNFFAFITAMLLATEPAKRLARLHVEISSSLLGVDLLYRFLDENTPESRAGRHPGAEDYGGPGRVRKYRVLGYRTGELVLNKLNLVAEPGKTTALVGRSGGGKTTAMSMILRFYEPTGGQDSHRRSGYLRLFTALAAQPDRLCRAGHLPVQRLDPRQYRLRPARRERRGDRCGGQGGFRA